MSRTEFMNQLERLLQDISADERSEAMQYYNDYFDDAGTDNETYIISELGSPEKVAATIKAGLRGVDEQSGEYRETGYNDTRFEDKKSPASRETDNNNKTRRSQYTNTPLKIILIILIILIGLPTVVPIAAGLGAAALGIICAFFAILISLVIISASVAIIGVVMVVAGLIQIFIYLPLGLALIGAGLLVSVLGTIGTLFTGKLCWVMIPAVFRAIVELCRRIFNRKAVSA